MKSVFALVAIAITTAHLCFAAEENAYMPTAVEKCLGADIAASKLVPVQLQNPYYLRGDFDGDGKPDLVVAVRSKATNKDGVIICGSAIGRHVVGPVEGASRDADVPADIFSNHWEVATRKDLLDMQKDVGKRVPLPKGEAILMVWEDATGILYWDGKRVRWFKIEGED